MYSNIIKVNSFYLRKSYFSQIHYYIPFALLLFCSSLPVVPPRFFLYAPFSHPRCGSTASSHLRADQKVLNYGVFH